MKNCIATSASLWSILIAMMFAGAFGCDGGKDGGTPDGGVPDGAVIDAVPDGSFPDVAAGDSAGGDVPVAKNPCSTNNGGCGPVSVATCTVSGGGAPLCACKNGYQDNDDNGSCEQACGASPGLTCQAGTCSDDKGPATCTSNLPNVAISLLEFNSFVKGSSTLVLNYGVDATDQAGKPIEDGDALETGLVWAEVGEPTVDDGRSNDCAPNVYTNIGSKCETWLGRLGLDYARTFKFRAYVKTVDGIAYSASQTLTTPKPVVGNYLWGGRIFYVDGTGVHGYVALTEATTAWSGPFDCGYPELQGIKAQIQDAAIGAGEKNTKTILGACTNPDGAARFCSKLTTAETGVGQWWLPSWESLVLISKSKSQLQFTDKSGDPYFSSTVSDFSGSLLSLYLGSTSAKSTSLTDPYSRRVCVTEF